MIELHNVAKVRIAPRFGWTPDICSESDWQLNKTSVASQNICKEVDLTAYFRPISDQMQWSSCTANAVCDVWEAHRAIEFADRGVGVTDAVSSVPDFSRMFAWWNGRNAMDPPQGRYDTGCYNRLVVDSIARFGVPTEAAWPYIAANVTRRPSLLAYKEAVNYRGNSYYAIGEVGPARIEMLCRALTARRPVVFGCWIDNSFMKYQRGTIWQRTGVAVGGHAMAIVGYSLSRKAFKVRNSWSTYWGEDGYCWISEAHMSSDECNSFWCCG